MLDGIEVKIRIIIVVSLVNSGARFVDVHHSVLASLANVFLFNFLIYSTAVLVSNGLNAEQAMRKDQGPDLEMAAFKVLAHDTWRMASQAPPW